MWGLWHGVGLALWQLLQTARRRMARGVPAEPTRAGQLLGVFLTFHVVSFAWILFRCESGAKALEFLRALFGYSSQPELVTFATWLAYVGIVLFLYLRPVKPQAPQPARVEAGTGATAG